MGRTSYLLLCILVINVYITSGNDKPGEGYCSKEKCAGPVFIGNFHIPTEPIPRLPFSDKQAKERLQNGLPVILTDTNLFTTESPWSFEYLAKIFSKSEGEWQVFNATGRRFLYFGTKRNYANYKWKAPYTSRYMPFPKFVELYRAIEKAGNDSRVYMQTGLYEESTAGAKYHLNRTVLDEIGTASKRYAPGTSHWFYIGMRDVYTSMHFDYSDHVVAQIYGHKKWTILSPEQYGNMYTYPMSSPFDRNSRVDFENPDYKRFPKFKNVKGFEAILRPGDVLYVPALWWHLVESEHHSETVSLSMDQHNRDVEFLNMFSPGQSAPFRPQKDSSVAYTTKEEFVKYNKHLRTIFGKKEDHVVHFERPDSIARQVHVRRIIETMIAESVGNYRKVGPILKEMYEGRFDGLEYEDE